MGRNGGGVLTREPLAVKAKDGWRDPPEDSGNLVSIQWDEEAGYRLLGEGLDRFAESMKSEGANVQFRGVALIVRPDVAGQNALAKLVDTGLAEWTDQAADHYIDSLADVEQTANQSVDASFRTAESRAKGPSPDLTVKSGESDAGTSDAVTITVNRRTIAVLSGALVILGCIGPWLSAPGPDDANGFEWGTTWIILFAGIVGGGIAAIAWPQSSRMAGLAFALAAGMAVQAMFWVSQVSKLGTVFGVDASIGWGLILVLVASILGIVASWSPTRPS